MVEISTERVHGTCVALGPAAVLIRGASGAGKSDLALRFIMASQVGFSPAKDRRLVSDDQVLLTRDGKRLVAAAPAAISGKLEVRGVGIIDVSALASASVVAVVDLARREMVERMPEEGRTVVIAGTTLPLHHLYAFEASAPLKLALILEKYSKSSH